MVCSFETGRMAVMARLLAARSSSRIMAEDDVVSLKSAAEYICRELRQADEANWLDEEDMHVFGLKPLTDPLQLVCCNSCKKPIKASQYVAHAELCRSLQFRVETILEVDGSMGNRKPPKKEKKKSSTSNATTAIRGPERAGVLDAADIVASESHVDKQLRGNSACIDVASMKGGSGISPGNRDFAASSMPPPTKRLKLIGSDCCLSNIQAEEREAVTKPTIVPEEFACLDFDGRVVLGHGNCEGRLLDHKGRGNLQDVIKGDFPLPVATKTYYSQKNNRLRSTLTHMFFQASMEQNLSDMTIANSEKAIAQQISHPRDSPVEDDVLNKSYVQTLASIQIPDQVVARSLDILGKARNCLPNSNLSHQYHHDDVLKPAASPMELISSLPKHYSFAGGSGKPLGTIQQPSGSVPVI